MQRVERLRGRAGQRQRQRRLARTNGLCHMCLALGRVTIATVVNHITPLAHGGSDEDDNTENLCREHDLEVTAHQFGHDSRAGDRGVDADGRPVGRDHPWSAARGVGAGQISGPARAGHRAVGPYAPRRFPK